MKSTLIQALAASALLASGSVLACDDHAMSDDSQASKAPEQPVVVAAKPAASTQKVVKAKTPAKPVAQANVTLTRTGTN